MATREENTKKINDELEKMSEEELGEVAGGNTLPPLQPNQQGYYYYSQSIPSQGNRPTYPQNYPPYPTNYPPNPNPGSWNQPPQGNRPIYPPNYPPNPNGSWNQPPQGYQPPGYNWNVPPTQK